MEEKMIKTEMSADAFEPGKLADEVRIVIGERSIVAFAKETGISKSYISKIVNGKLPVESPPSKKILMKMMNANKAHQSGITLSDLFASCGYSVNGLAERQGADDFNRPKLTSSTVRKYYNNALPMAAASILMNALASNGMGTVMSLQAKGSYFEINFPDHKKSFIGIPAFCQKKDAFVLMYASVLSTLLVLSERFASTVFYVLTDDRSFSEFLLDKLKVPSEMQVAILYTQDYKFVESEYKIGGSKAVWYPDTLEHSALTAKGMNNSSERK